MKKDVANRYQGNAIANLAAHAKSLSVAGPACRCKLV
jgi:hypothetical protein